MKFDWKLPTFAAGGAFLLSFFTGIFGRVGFGTVLLRALLFALLFGGVAIGINLLLRKYLPEIFSSGGESRDIDTERTVDITLGEEDAGGEGMGDTIGDAGLDEEPANTSYGEFDEADVFGESDQVEEVEELEPETENEVNGEEGELPSFDSVESTFVSGENNTGNDASNASNVELFGSEEDPEVVARAVRTLMNKD